MDSNSESSFDSDNSFTNSNVGIRIADLRISLAEVEAERPQYLALLDRFSEEFGPGKVVNQNQSTSLSLSQSTQPGVVWKIDLLLALCDVENGICSETIPETNTLGFGDADHIRDAAGMFLRTPVCKELREIWHNSSIGQ